MSLCYGALELKAGYQRNLAFGLLLSVVAFLSFLVALLTFGRLADVINEPKRGKVIILPAPRPETPPKPPSVRKTPPPVVPLLKLGTLVPDALFPSEILDQQPVRSSSQMLLDDLIAQGGTGISDGQGASADAVVDLDLEGLKPVILHKVAPEYPALARQQGIAETVVAELVVGTDGLVRKVLIRKNRTGIFDEEVKSALKQWIFRPLVVDERVMMFRYLEVVRFTLR